MIDLKHPLSKDLVTAFLACGCGQLHDLRVLPYSIDGKDWAANCAVLYLLNERDWLAARIAVFDGKADQSC